MTAKKVITKKEQLREPLTVPDLPKLLISKEPTTTELEIINQCYDQGFGAAKAVKQLFALTNTQFTQDEIHEIYHAIEAERNQRFLSKCDPNTIDPVGHCDQSIAKANDVSQFWLNKDYENWLKAQDNERKWLLLREQIANKQLQNQQLTQNNNLTIIEQGDIDNDRREAIKRLLPES